MCFCKENLNKLYEDKYKREKRCASMITLPPVKACLLGAMAISLAPKSQQSSGPYPPFRWVDMGSDEAYMERLVASERFCRAECGVVISCALKLAVPLSPGNKKVRIQHNLPAVIFQKQVYALRQGGDILGSHYGTSGSIPIRNEPFT